MSGQIGFLAAFTAGLLSFLSPCVLPLIPGYLSFMTGMSSAELADEDRQLSSVLVPALLFIAGFTFVFVALGASASLIGQLLDKYQDVLRVIGGAAVIAFGVLMLGVIKVPWLYGEARADLGRARRFGVLASLVMGMAFAAGWTPCVGPMLGSILTLAAATGSAGSGALLLFVYSLGLGLPFLAVALLFGKATGLIRWLSRHSLVVNRVAGATLIVLGALILTNRLGVVASWLTAVL